MRRIITRKYQQKKREWIAGTHQSSTVFIAGLQYRTV